MLFSMIYTRRPECVSKIQYAYPVNSFAYTDCVLFTSSSSACSKVTCINVRIVWEKVYAGKNGRESEKAAAWHTRSRLYRPFGTKGKRGLRAQAAIHFIQGTYYYMISYGRGVFFKNNFRTIKWEFYKILKNTCFIIFISYIFSVIFKF